MIHQADADSHRSTQIPIDLSQPLVLTVHSPSGDISVRATDRPDVLIGFGSPDQWEDPDDEVELMIEVHDNRIEVRPKQRGNAGWGGLAGEIDLETVAGQITKALRFAGPLFATKPGHMRAWLSGDDWPDIDIEIPRSVAGRIEVHSASGDVLVEGCSGEIALSTMSGDLRAVHSSGNLALRAQSGDLLAEDVSGRLTAHVTDGDIRLIQARCDGFEMQTVNGDVLVDAMLSSDGPFRAQTVSGDVRLTLRRAVGEGEEPAATLTFRSVSGDARVAPPFRRIDHRRWQSGAGKPGPRIDVTTVSGELAAEIAGAESAVVSAPSPAVHVADVPPAPPMPQSQEMPSDLLVGEPDVAADAMPETAPIAHDSAARLAVLEAVERGEIDVEEALRRLEVADNVANP